MADLFDAPAAAPAPVSIQSAAAPFLRWIAQMETHYGDHKDDALVAGFRGIGITFGDLRRLRDAVNTTEHLHKSGGENAAPPDLAD